MKYTSIRREIGLHVDKVAGLIDELANMGTVLPNDLTNMLHVASIDAPELKAVIAAIKTLADDKADWQPVYNLLIEEHRDIN